MKDGRNDSLRLRNDDAIRVHIHFDITTTMVVRSETQYFGVFPVAGDF